MNLISINELPEDEAAGKARVIILGAARSLKGDLPAALVQTAPGSRVLDWQLASFDAVPDLEVSFVGGFRAEDVARSYPGIRFFYNPAWETTGPLASLSMAPWSRPRETFVTYADVVFRPETVEALRADASDVALAVDSMWLERFESRSEADIQGAEKVRLENGRVVEISRRLKPDRVSGEFAGLLKLSPRAARAVGEALLQRVFDDRADLPALITHLIESGFQVSVVDVCGDWAELNAPQDLSRFVLGTKAESLERLRPLLRTGRIGELVRFTHERWDRDRAGAIDEIQQTFPQGAVIVRSSALAEDGWSASAAGAHQSVLDVDPADEAALERAVEEVFASYGETRPDNQVLVQAMLRDTAMSGVIMTRSSTHGGPYYVINFDDASSRTDSVTAGDADGLRTVFLHRGAALRSEMPAALNRLLETVAEVEALVGHDSLDIEFAVGAESTVHILQVRPIAVTGRQLPVDDHRIAANLQAAERAFETLGRPRPFLVGEGAAFSVMTDWNPAEMIGCKPRPLAFSLYRHLISDEPWARQRAEYGYRDVRPAPLIVDFAGHPYVDLRVDFNSFVPAELSDDLAERLVDHYLQRIRQNPELHDKAEFDVLLTCLTFDFDLRSRALRDAGFPARDIDRIRQSLRSLTGRGIGRLEADLAACEAFRHRFDRIRTAEMPPLERAYFLLEDVRRLGVPVFAHLARHAFVAVDLLKSLVVVEAVTQEEVDAFLASLETVPTRMANDARRVADGDLAWDAFVAEYGHLRPGSYDITAASYAEAPERYLRPMLKTATAPAGPAPSFDWRPASRAAIGERLHAEGLGVDFDAFNRFLRGAIEGREFGKFTFMRNLDAALTALIDFGRSVGLSRDDLSFIRISDFLALRDGSRPEAASLMKTLSAQGRQAFYDAQATCLPDFIQSPEEFRCFEQGRAVANFVTTGRVEAPVRVLDGEPAEEGDLRGRIVLIPNADPGFDWIFSREVGGLITMYGGINSHMAIRAAELDLPAAIGVGEPMFERLVSASLIDLNCADRQIRIIHQGS